MLSVKFEVIVTDGVALLTICITISAEVTETCAAHAALDTTRKETESPSFKDEVCQVAAFSPLIAAPHVFVVNFLRFFRLQMPMKHVACEGESQRNDDHQNDGPECVVDV